MNAVTSSPFESVVVDRARKLEIELRRDIPLARMMDIRIASWDGERVTLVAPAEPNVNDKGCAFGGRLASLMTLAGWALLRLAMVERGVPGDAYVQDSQICYLAPFFAELLATARSADGA
mgnify:CR=1 FL=1